MGNDFWWMGILLAVLLVAAFIVLRTKLKQIGIKRTCCGGGQPVGKREEKILTEDPVWEITVQIDDLCCEHCAIRVENALNGMDGVAARASHEEKRAVLLLCREWDEKEIRAAVASCGFTASAIQTKRVTPAES